LVKYDPLYHDIISEEKITGAYIDLVINLLLENVTSDQDIKTRTDVFLRNLRASVDEYRVMMPIEKLELIG
jgi:hypothetical protein